MVVMVKKATFESSLYLIPKFSLIMKLHMPYNIADGECLQGNRLGPEIIS